MHSWGCAVTKGVSTGVCKENLICQLNPKKIILKIKKNARKANGASGFMELRAPEHRDYDTPSL